MSRGNLLPYPSVAIANAFLGLGEVRQRGGLTQMQLQKLVYMAHGWNVVINGERLVEEDPEAWTHGPVFRELYHHTNGHGSAPINRQLTFADSRAGRIFGGVEPIPYHANLNNRELAVVTNVWARYGALDGIRLSELTHQPGSPWFEAYTRNGRDTRITLDLIEPHYQDLLRRAQANQQPAH